MKRLITLMLIGMATFAFAEAPKEDVQEEVKKDTAQVSRATKLLKRQIKTRYDITGRVVNQRQDSKGYHRIVDSASLSNGVDTITLNTSITNGQQDVSFLDATTFFGTAWASSLTSRGNTYTIIPLSATQFIVVSSDTTDSATVRFQVEGE